MLTALTLGLAAFLTWQLAILLYQFAHSWAADWFGVPTEEISVGFGPRIYQRRFDNWTFSIGVFILGGGFTKLQRREELELIEELPSRDVLEEPPRQIFLEDASPFQRMVIFIAGPAVHLVLGLFLLFLPIAFGARQLTATSPEESTVQPCAVPGLILLDQPSSWHAQGDLIQQTAFEFLWRVVTFESLEGWGGFLGFCVTTGLVGSQSGWAWITCMGILLLFNGTINLIPLPVLNGGHVVFLFYEVLAGRPVREGIRLFFTYIGLLILCVMTFRIWWIDLRWLWQVITA